MTKCTHCDATVLSTSQPDPVWDDPADVWEAYCAETPTKRRSPQGALAFGFHAALAAAPAVETEVHPDGDPEIADGEWPNVDNNGESVGAATPTVGGEPVAAANKPICEHCGASVVDPCATAELAKKCELPEFAWPNRAATPGGKPVAWGRVIDGKAVTVSIKWTPANDEPLYAAQPASQPAIGGEANTKLVYIKRWRTIIKVPEQYADEIVDALRVQPASPLRGREELIEDVAQWLHDETDDPDSFPGFGWPLHENDTGQRGADVWKRLIPLDVVEAFRAKARRLVGRFGVNLSASPPEQPAARPTTPMGLDVEDASRLPAADPEQPATPGTVKMFVEAIDAKNARIAQLEEALGKAVLSEQPAAARCDRCGSSGDVFMMCAGCQSPLGQPGREAIIKECELAARGAVYKEIYNGCEGNNWSMDSEYGRGRHAAADAVRALSDQETI